MNKKISVFLAIFFLTFFIYYGDYVSVATKQEDPALFQIADIIKKEPIQVTEWYLYSRESLTNIDDRKGFEKKFFELKNAFGSFNWTVKREREAWRAVGTKKHPHISLEEKVELITTLKNGKAYTYLLYSVKGQKWEKENSALYKQVYEENYHKIFTINPLTFSCMKGQFNDKIESVLSVKVRQLLRDFQAVPIESLTEESFVSVSAYTEVWEDALPTEHQRMNLQIALRKAGLGGQTTVVIGTPIITSEY